MRLTWVSLVLIGYATTILGANGIAVNVQTTNRNHYGNWYLDQYDNDAPLIRTNIQNNTITGTQTLCESRSCYPAFNIYGNKVVFYRHDQETWQLAVVNIDGTGLENLVALESAGIPLLDWPVGNYVYYHKPASGGKTGSREIWKIDVTNPGDNTLALALKKNDNLNKDLMRFSMSADGNRSGLRALGQGWNNVAFTAWPPSKDNIAPTSGTSVYSDPDDPSVSECNIQISPTGAYIGTYIHYLHREVSVHAWDLQTGEVTGVVYDDADKVAQSTWANEPLIEGSGGEPIRWACNSDKWYLERFGNRKNRSVLTNWVDEQAIFLGIQLCAGDFWVEPPAGKNGMVEKVDGTWVGVGATAVQSPARASLRMKTSVHAPVREVLINQSGRTSGIQLSTPNAKMDIRGRLISGR